MSTSVQENTDPEGSQWPITSPCSVSRLGSKMNTNVYGIVIIVYMYIHRAQGQNASTTRKNKRKTR